MPAMELIEKIGLIVFIVACAAAIVAYHAFFQRE